MHPAAFDGQRPDGPALSVRRHSGATRRIAPQATTYGAPFNFSERSSGASICAPSRRTFHRDQMLFVLATLCRCQRILIQLIFLNTERLTARLKQIMGGSSW
jgi:hypothetical protein